MAKYYYTVASLPLLFYEEDLSIDIEQFISICEREISGENIELLRAASAGATPAEESTEPTYRQWSAWERQLRFEIAKIRAQSLGKELSIEEPEDVAYETARIAREASVQDSPLQAEFFLTRARWDFLDSLEIGHYFDMDKLVIYALKLRLLTRKALFKQELGEEKFQQIYNKIASTLEREDGGAWLQAT